MSKHLDKITEIARWARSAEKLTGASREEKGAAALAQAILSVISDSNMIAICADCKEAITDFRIDRYDDLRRCAECSKLHTLENIKSWRQEAAELSALRNRG